MEMPYFTGLNKIYENPNNLKPVLTKVGKGAFQMSAKSRQEKETENRETAEKEAVGRSRASDVQW